MAPDGSVTRWLASLREGDAAAAQALWERYFHRLVGLARAKLQNRPGRATDGEDVALSAFDSFFRNAERGRFPDVADRDGLWRLLVVITARKAAHLRRDAGRLKRGGAARDLDAAVLDDIAAPEPSPEFAAQAAEEYERLLATLGDPELVSVAVWRMEGYSVDEIADRLGYAPRSIKRKLQAIRGLWQKEVER